MQQVYFRDVLSKVCPAGYLLSGLKFGPSTLVFFSDRIYSADTQNQPKAFLSSHVFMTKNALKFRPKTYWIYLHIGQWFWCDLSSPEVSLRTLIWHYFISSEHTCCVSTMLWVVVGYRMRSIEGEITCSLFFWFSLKKNSIIIVCLF